MLTINYVAIIGMVVSLLGLVAGEARAEKRIGVFMFSEEARYMDAARGFKERLAEAGFDKNKVTYVDETAGGNKARAAEIVSKFAGQKPDLILSLGTSATVPLSREITDVPIVFSIVYDPVDSGIAAGWQSSGNNTTGCSTMVPVSTLMGVLKKFARVKTMAVLYTAGEKNSESQLRNLQKIQDEYEIKVRPVSLSKKTEIGQLLSVVLPSVDALYVTGSTLVNSQMEIITNMAVEARVITLTHLEDLVEKGVLLGVSTDSYELGRLAGDKAIKIFEGATPSSIPIETANEVIVMLNMTTAKRISFPIPTEFMSSSIKKVE